MHRDGAEQTLRRAVQREDTPTSWNLGFQNKAITQGIPKSSHQLAIDQKFSQNGLLEQGCEGAASYGGENGRNEAWEGVLNSQPWWTDRPVPQSVDRLVNDQRSTVVVNGQFFQILLHFLVSWSSPCHFQLKSPIFYVQCHGNFDFWSKFDLFPMIISIWCIWYEFHTIIGYIRE